MPPFKVAAIQSGSEHIHFNLDCFAVASSASYDGSDFEILVRQFPAHAYRGGRPTDEP
jgi:hypothetical protein